MRGVQEREAAQAERGVFKLERDQLAADRAKFAEGRAALEREMKGLRDMALDLESKVMSLTPGLPRGRSGPS